VASGGENKDFSTRKKPNPVPRIEKKKQTDAVEPAKQFGVE